LPTSEIPSPVVIGRENSALTEWKIGGNFGSDQPLLARRSSNRIGAAHSSMAPSDALTTTAFLLDAKGIVAELDTVKLDSTGNAALQLDSDPTSGSYQLVSLFQNNLTALRCEIEFGALALRSTSVTMLTGYAA
jgi:hypothetical protein